MIDIKSKNYLLFIEPSANRTLEPIIDSLTKKITASLRKAKAGVEHNNIFKENTGYMGWHTDACGCDSCCSDRLLPNGEITNTLAIHYVAFHRWEIPLDQIKRIEALTDGEVEPTTKELWPQGIA